MVRVRTADEDSTRARPFEEAARQACRTHWQKPSRNLRQSRRTRRPSGPTPSAPKPGPASRSSADGEEPDAVLAPGTARRRALDDALAEIAAGRPDPSPEWKVRFALLLGLERVLSERPPHLASGTELRRHQVDALAGMLTELIAANQKGVNGNGNGQVEEPVAEDDDEPEDELELATDADDELPRAAARRPGSRRDPPLSLPPPDGVRQDDRRMPASSRPPAPKAS